MAIEFPLINGRAKSWASIGIKLAGLPEVTGFTGAKYSDKLISPKGYGTGSFPKYRGRGKYEAEAELTGYRDAMNALRDIFAIREPRGYALFEFPVVVQFSEFDSGPISTDTLEECRIEEESQDASEGDELIKITWKLSVMRVRWNGHYKVAGPLQ